MKRWISTAKLRALYSAGLTLDEIASANERAEGWRPTRSTVSKKLLRMNLPPRYASHLDLLPWHVRPEHNSERLRHMLQAESRKRQGVELTDSDRALTGVLYDLLFGRGRLMVVGYHPEIGFFLAERADTDRDIIRQPVKDRTGHEIVANEID